MKSLLSLGLALVISTVASAQNLSEPSSGCRAMIGVQGKVFAFLDLDRDTKISRDEALRGFDKTRIAMEKMGKIRGLAIAPYDMNRDRRLDTKDLLTIVNVVNNVSECPAGHTRKFSMLDRNHNGKVLESELQVVLATLAASESENHYDVEFDFNRDGVLNGKDSEIARWIFRLYGTY